MNVYEAYKQEYFGLCESIITDTNLISRDTAYKTSERLQTSESNQKLERLDELLDQMKQHEGTNDVYIGMREMRMREYEMILDLKEVYGKWGALTEQEKIEVTSQYGVINGLYSLEIDERKKKD
ncbi:MAG TPA: hypothetical protein VEF53_05265 [Patescibacteria group bacterium]|nr:hypothetical protein [Patescibacteria group bacterium]